MPVRAWIVVQRVADHRERGQPEEVHLEHAGLLQRIHVVLRHDDRLVRSRAGAFGVRREDRDVVVERARRDHDARRVHARVPRESLERDRVVEQLLVALVALRTAS